MSFIYDLLIEVANLSQKFYFDMNFGDEKSYNAVYDI